MIDRTMGLMPVRRMSPDDRNVVAEIACTLATFELVRYDNGGKWFIEWPSGDRVIVSGDEAVSVARTLAHTVHPGVHGADAFYRHLRE